jgi:hypothetical protein
MRSWCWVFVAGMLAFSDCAFCQQFSFGVVGGAPVTSSVITNPDGFTFGSAHKYIIGASAEVGLPFGLSVEGDFLIHPFDIEVGANPPPHFGAQSLYDYNVFEIPVLAKAHFTNGIIRPFVEGGVSFRGSVNSLNVSHYGLTLGGGLEIGMRKLLRFSPQLRYIRWGADSLITVNGSRVAAEQANQLEALIGISF